MNLQFGHGTVTVENSPNSINYHLGNTAYLQFGHGTVTVENGEPDRILRYPYTVLQFGHGTVTVENAVWRKRGGRGGSLLQFGHGTVTVENGGPAPRRWGLCRLFNLATARSPWRTQAG